MSLEATPKLKNYFGKHRAFLRAFGISLEEHESFAYKIYAFFLVIIFGVMYGALVCSELFKHHMGLIGDSIVYQFAVTMALAKVLLILRYRAKFRIIFSKLEEPPFKPNLERGGEIEEKIIEECLWISQFQTYMYWALASLTVIAGVTYTLIARMRDNTFQELTFGPITFLNITNSPDFQITALYQGLSFIHLGLLFCTSDLLLACILAHISYQFKMLQNNLRRLVTIAHNKMIKDLQEQLNINLIQNTEVDAAKIHWKYLRAALIEAVDYHLAIIDLANEIENVFSIFLLFVFLSTLIMIGFLTFRSSQMHLDDGRLLPRVGETLTVCVQVLIVCYWGEEMVLQSQLVGTAAYESSFAGTDIKFQKSLVLIMRRSLNPTNLTAGKFAAIGLTTFIWIMRSAYTAFMVLRKNNLESN